MPLLRKIFVNIMPRKASYHDNMEKHSRNVSDNHESSTKYTRGYFSPSTEYDWETLDDHETWAKCRAWETLSNALNSEELSLSSLITNISRDFSSGCVLHEAIELGVPNHVLMLLADRFPAFLTQVDSNGRYPLHVACAYGASSKFVARCIERSPLSATSTDNHGNTPIRLLCQGTWTDFWDAKSNSSAAEKNMRRILRMLYNKDPSSVLCEDKNGVGSIECALLSDLGAKFVKDLQMVIGDFNRANARKTAHQKCLLARQQLFKTKSPRAALAA